MPTPQRGRALLNDFLTQRLHPLDQAALERAWGTIRATMRGLENHISDFPNILVPSIHSNGAEMDVCLLDGASIR